MNYYLVEIKSYDFEEKFNILVAADSYKDVFDKIIPEYILDKDIENIKIYLICDVYQELTEEMVSSIKKFAEIE